MSANRTENGLLQDCYFGPSIEQSEINAYKKYSSSKNSITSETSQKEIQKEIESQKKSGKASLNYQIVKAKQQFSKKNQNLQASQSNFIKGSRRNLFEGKLQYSEKLEKASKKESFNFFKTIIKSNLIQKFKHNLLSSSYVLLKDLKILIFSDQFKLNPKKFQF